MEYRIVADNELENFQRQVNQIVESGWIPQGGVSVVAIPEMGTFVYYQAIIRQDYSQFEKANG